MERSAAQVRENYKRITDRIGEAMAKYRRPEEQVQLMAVTKTVDPELVNTAVECGVRLLGENRVQEYESKKARYDSRAEVQFIGQLQTNKVKYLIPGISMIQSVDSLRLADEIERIAARAGKVQDILLEVNIGGEESKGGIPAEELHRLLEEVAQKPHLHVCGLMTIPPKTDTEKYFFRMQKLFIDISAENMDNIDMHVLSMGMSGDYVEAIKYGSTLVRIGSALFGARG
ncbi:YggS family pyridoxal phosphate-dependent enzyme [Ruminococcus sp.]|uniref:YggS family pyridoxal phosphate-dependent enzyme n=1 Tax=Ruminococcus sp. TaxID=41978 RepID=UPI003F0454BD